MALLNFDDGSGQLHAPALAQGRGGQERRGAGRRVALYVCVCIYIYIYMCICIYKTIISLSLSVYIYIYIYMYIERKI